MTLPLSLEQRIALGRQQRKSLPRVQQSAWTPKLRRQTPLKLLKLSGRGRVPALLEIKYQRMAASPFGFFRGAVPVMAYDLSLMPSTGIRNQLCGDAHIRNLGAFAGTDGRLLFDINDFDETIIGPFEWDLKRMATSLILAGREAGAKDVSTREAASLFLEHYRTAILIFASMPVLEVARFQVHRLGSIAPISGILRLAERATPCHNLEALTQPAHPDTNAALKPAKDLNSSKPLSTSKTPNSSKNAQGAATKSSAPTTKLGAPSFAALSQRVGSKRRKISKLDLPAPQPNRIFKTIQPTLTRVTGAAAQRVVDSLATYADSLLPERRHFLAQYRPIDVAFKVVGTGSVGLRDFCIYMQGNGPNDPLFLQIKEEAASAYEPYLGPSTPYHQGRRVVEGERAMQLQSDPFLGWTTIQGRDYLVRQLNDHKASIDLTALKSQGLLEYAAVCGEMLARGHARAGDSVMLAGYLGNSARCDKAITAFALAYADQTEQDWKQLVRSRKTTNTSHHSSAGRR